jgi:hypothetical protein
MDKSVYYLPGANGRLETGLGEGLTSRGFRVWGRAAIAEFKKLSFQEKVEIIAGDLEGPLWLPEARVVTNSYGGYLFLNAQLGLPPYPGRVLMLSPILGGFADEQTGKTFIPPYSDRLMRVVRTGEFPVPRQLQIHTGSIDWQSPPELVNEFGELTGASVTIAPGRGHMLGKEYVGPVLDAWLASGITP